jgi:2-phospho-L-lactate guanylyltransferase
MRWTALIPLKGGAKRKSRLAPCLSPAERAALSDRMVRHVCAVLGEVPSI